MNKILIFNKSLYHISETFIHRQVVALSRQFQLAFLAFQFNHQDKFSFSTDERYRLSTSKNLIDRIASILVRRLLGRPLSFSIMTNVQLNRILRHTKVDLIHAHYGWNGVAILQHAKKFGIPLMVSFHGNDASGELRKTRYRKQLKPLFEYAKAIIICTNYMRATLCLHEYDLKVHVVPYGIDVDEFAPAHKIAASDKIKILHIGRVVAKKGVPDLIRVINDLYRTNKNIELHIVGRGEELVESKNLAASLGISQVVIFYDAQPLSVVKKLLADSDIFVLNSRTDSKGDMEGLPNALLEAMSSEKAVISTYHGGITDAITNEVNGLLVEERNNAQLYSALQKLILDSRLRVQIGINARKTVIEKFSIEKMNLSLMAIAERAMKH
jgi:colanic acid/amylovoran biosynthesis glycosyltransferase